MSLHRLFAITRKEFHHVTRDARTLFLVTIAPAFLLFTLAYVFSMDAEHFNLIVLDQDKTSLSRQYVADLTSDGSFHVAAYVDRYIGKYGSKTLDNLRAKPYYTAPANYGSAGTSRWDRDGREIFTGLTLPEMESILKERGMLYE